MKKFAREIARDKEINRRHAAGEVLSGDIDYGKNRAKSQALKAAKTGKLHKFGTNNMETRRRLMGKKSTTEHFEQ